MFGGHRAFGRHAGVPERMGSLHGGDAEPGGDVARQTDILKYLNGVAEADDAHAGMIDGEPGANVVGCRGDGQNAVRANLT